MPLAVRLRQIQEWSLILFAATFGLGKALGEITLVVGLLQERRMPHPSGVRRIHCILQTHGWKKILLVSSPYHMRRTHLVWQKQAPEVTVLDAPIPISRFYGDGSKVTLQYVKAIFHEYLGLCYYWLKGWI